MVKRRPHGPRSAPAGAVAVVVLVLALAGCSGSDDGSTTTSTTDAGVTRCAWATRADEETLNIAYPDTAATYWGLAYDLAPGESLELHGTFPDARYASFISYAPTGGALDVVTDRDLQPDDGEQNPFADAAADPGTGTYTLAISGDAAEADGANVLAADVEDATVDAGTTTTGGDGSTTAAAAPAVDSDKLLGSGGTEATGGVTLYRVYLPTDGADPTGGAGLPEVTLVGADGTRTPVPTCEDPGASPTAAKLVETNGPPTDRPAPSEPVFLRPSGDATNLFPNPDNVYLATIAAYESGRIVVIHGLSPSFPSATADVTNQDADVRYWSVCSDEYRKPYPVTACLTDEEVTAPDGTYTVVLSTPEDRPSSTQGDDAVPWLDWGTTEVDNLVLIRHMLANPDAPGSAADVARGALASTAMGDRTPEALYCQKATFEAGGLEACEAEAATG